MESVRAETEHDGLFHGLVDKIFPVDISYLLPRKFNIKRSALGLKQTLQLLCVQADWLQTGPNSLIPKASHAGKGWYSLQFSPVKLHGATFDWPTWFGGQGQRRGRRRCWGAFQTGDSCWNGSCIFCVIFLILEVWEIQGVEAKMFCRLKEWPPSWVPVPRQEVLFDLLWLLHSPFEDLFFILGLIPCLCPSEPVTKGKPPLLCPSENLLLVQSSWMLWSRGQRIPCMCAKSAAFRIPASTDI